MQNALEQCVFHRRCVFFWSKHLVHFNKHQLPEMLSIIKYLKACSKMIIISRQNVAIRIKVKHLLNVNSLEIIWSSFWLIIMNKLLRKPVLVRKSLFHLFRHWFLTLCFFLTKETSHSNMFLQRKLSEMNLFHGCFHNLAPF